MGRADPGSNPAIGDFFYKGRTLYTGGEEFKRRKLTKIGQGEENIKQRGREPWSSGYGRRFMFQRS